MKIFKRFFLLCFSWTFLLYASSVLEVHNLPESIVNPDQFLKFIENELTSDISVEKSAKSVTLKQGNDFYQVYFHKSKIIQFSTLTNQKLKTVEPIQFSKTGIRDPLAIMALDPESKIFFETELTHAFNECNRVLKIRGIFVVVFAHKLKILKC